MTKQQLEEILAEARTVAALFVEHYMVPNTWEPVRRFIAKLEEHDGPITLPSGPDEETPTEGDQSTATPAPDQQAPESEADQIADTAGEIAGSLLAPHEVQAPPSAPPPPQGPIGVIVDPPVSDPAPASLVSSPEEAANVSPPEVAHDEVQPAAREELPDSGTDGGA